MERSPHLTSEAQYTTPDAADDAALPDVIADSLQALVSVRPRLIAHHKLVLLDTFNGRIDAAGGRLMAHAGNGGARLAWEPRDREVRLEVSVKKPVDFAWDLPCGPLRDSLEPIIGVRRLLPQVEVEIHGRMLDVLDDERKTVARVRIEVGRARRPGFAGPWQPIRTLVTLTGLKGYGAAYERLLRIIESRPGLKRSPAGLQLIAFEALGMSAPRDVSRFNVALEPSVRAAAGARQIHRALLDVMVANEPGVRADLDTEFLHDYRVSLRRTRSLLSQIKDVFPADAVTHFRNEFQWLAQATNTKRDLDVLLLSLRRTSESLPADDLAAFFAFLSRKQVHEQGVLKRLLESDRYEALLEGWRNFLQDPPPGVSGPAHAPRPLVEVTSRRILRLYRRLFDHAMAIHDKTPADAIHQVRIEAKKLRYMIDATRSLHDHRDLDPIIDVLKRVQSVLGDFNDAQVQERSLLDFGRDLAEAGAGEPAALLTVGRLAENARSRMVLLRAQVDRELSRFCKDGIRTDICRLFKRTTSVRALQ
jgi:CHAD domain-containing protein